MKLRYNLINIKELLNRSTSVHMISETTDKGSSIESKDISSGLNIIRISGTSNNYLYTIQSLGKENDGVQLIIIPQYDNVQYRNNADNDKIQYFDNFKVYTFKYIEPKGVVNWFKTGEFHSEDGQIIDSYDYKGSAR